MASKRTYNRTQKRFAIPCDSDSASVSSEIHQATTEAASK